MYIEEKHTKESCRLNRIAVQDTLEVINGKWKLLILLSLSERPFRFKELAAELHISPKMLSKELQAMEADLLISRTVLDTRPITVQYAVTDHGLTFSGVLNALRDWGLTHRKKVIHNIRKNRQ